MEEVKLAYYRKKDWNKLVKLVDDPGKIHASWDDWHKDYQKEKRALKRQGVKIFEFPLNVDELAVYCRIKGIKIDEKARAQFTQDK